MNANAGIAIIDYAIFQGNARPTQERFLVSWILHLIIIIFTSLFVSFCFRFNACTNLCCSLNNLYLFFKS